MKRKLYCKKSADLLSRVHVYSIATRGNFSLNLTFNKTLNNNRFQREQALILPLLR